MVQKTVMFNIRLRKNEGVVFIENYCAIHILTHWHVFKPFSLVFCWAYLTHQRHILRRQTMKTKKQGFNGMMLSRFRKHARGHLTYLRDQVWFLACNFYHRKKVIICALRTAQLTKLSASISRDQILPTKKIILMVYSTSYIWCYVKLRLGKFQGILRYVVYNNILCSKNSKTIFIFYIYVIDVKL